VRRSPERAYDFDFFERFATEFGWRLRPWRHSHATRPTALRCSA
jgi:hypothetical protein